MEYHAPVGMQGKNADAKFVLWWEWIHQLYQVRVSESKHEHIMQDSKMPWMKVGPETYHQNNFE